MKIGESRSYSIKDDHGEEHRVYETEPPLIVNTIEEQRWKEPEKELRRDERGYRPSEKGKEYQC